MIITGRTSLLALIDREKAIQQLSDAEICRRAGIWPNVLGNARTGHVKNLNTASTVALVNGLGFDLAAVPAGEPSDDAALRLRLRNLAKRGFDVPPSKQADFDTLRRSHYTIDEIRELLSLE